MEPLFERPAAVGATQSIHTADGPADLVGFE
jgi:hypothetical protein